VRTKFWTKDKLALLKKHYPNMSTEECARLLRGGISVDAVRKQASRMGLRKSRRYLRSLGRG